MLGPGNVSAISTQTNRISGTINVGPPGTDPFNIAATSSAIYVTDQGASTLTVINPSALKVTATVTSATALTAWQQAPDSSMTPRAGGSTQRSTEC